MSRASAIVVGAGVGGLAAAIDLARQGVDVTVLERGDGPGGKLAPLVIDDLRLDAGPTVFTMRWVFDSLFQDAGVSFAQAVPTTPLDLLARHAWQDGARLDLFADKMRSAEAIGQMAGAREARGYLAFCERAHGIYRTLQDTFICAEQPTPISLARNAGLSGLGDLWRISPFTTLWRALGEHFRDPRLKQLFGRYATYNGSSPFLSPATLMLIADVEQQGVWSVDGGMYRLAEAMAALAVRHGAILRYRSQVTRILVESRRASGVALADGTRLAADAVLFNGDASALADGRLGIAVAGAVKPTPREERSLSAVTFSFLAEPSGFPLERHNVFFSRDYAAEFDDILRRRKLPRDPTIYLCAQDRGAAAVAVAATPAPAGHAERFLCLFNAPPDGDASSLSAEAIEQCRQTILEALHRTGLRLNLEARAIVTRTPQAFEAMYPSTGGALYGQASHGWKASFSRPAAATRIPGLYLAGGSVHPGAGVPMATMSGRIAARRLLQDLASRRRFTPAATPGGTSTP